ncbi:MAG TPA: putative Ig domain-containing protein, partial [Verrucomicrobiae bacterium]|nr:putative Ig domain-containing protein [Verrucomicrobiae bacterium]
ISWAVFDITGDVSDVSTDGTLVQAHGGADLGTADVVDGSTFDINGVTFDDGYVFDDPSHKDTIGNRGGSYTAPNEAYATLCKYADRQGSGTATFTFTNLTVGSTYQIQLWHADNVSVARENGLALNDGGIVDTPAPGTSGHATLLREISEGGYGQYAIGTFVADATTLQFLARAYGNLTTTPAGQANATINGCQLRLIASAPDSTPPVLAGADIVDDQGGADVTENNPVTYTVTFSEDMDAATVDAADFSNAGSSSVTIGTITETSAGVFSVVATPTNAGTLQLQVSAGASLTDVAGNPLDTGSAIADDTVITVDAANVAPVWAADPVTEADATEDAAYASTLADDASDGNSDPLEYAKVSGPAWLNVASDGTLSGIPDNADVGLNVFTVSVTDNIIATPVEATLNITVINTNDAPVFTADPITGSDATEDSAYSGSLAGSANDVDPGASLAYAKVSGPAWLGVAGNGALTGMPSNADVGVNSFTVSVDDGNGGVATATLNITVINTNDAPTWASNPVSGANATEDSAYSGSLAGSASDVDPGASLTFAKLSGPAWLDVAPNGTLSGTPSNSDVGANSFSVSVYDGTAAPVEANLDITVINTNDAPVFITDPIVAAGASEGVAYTGQTLAGQATDADAGDTVTYSKVSGPAWLDVASDGTLSGTPDTGTAGLNSFVVRATDNNSASTDATLQITVTGLPLPWVSTDIGTGMLEGSATFDAGTFTQSGAGAVGSTSDNLHFTYQTLTGDGEIIARISDLNNTGNSSRVGVMIRDSLAANSKQILMGMAANNQYRWDRRTSTGGDTSSTKSSNGSVPDTWVRLVRSGTAITAYKSTDGTSWTTVGSTTNTTFAATCYIGLAVGSGSDTTLNTSQFGNVSVTP